MNTGDRKPWVMVNVRPPQTSLLVVVRFNTIDVSGDPAIQFKIFYRLSRLSTGRTGSAVTVPPPPHAQWLGTGDGYRCPLQAERPGSNSAAQGCIAIITIPPFSYTLLMILIHCQKIVDFKVKGTERGCRGRG